MYAAVERCLEPTNQLTGLLNCKNDHFDANNIMPPILPPVVYSFRSESAASSMHITLRLSSLHAYKTMQITPNDQYIPNKVVWTV
eukprot:scaffold21275_cov139-Skeletonema_dohrnii-CCMP3373.AAC.8